MKDRMMNNTKPLTPGSTALTASGPSPRTGARGAKQIVCLVLTLSALVAGCDKPGNFSPRFHLNRQGENADNFRVTGSEKDETEKKDKQFNIEAQQYISDALEAMFGTPDRPFVFRESGLDLRKIRMASGPVGGTPMPEQEKEVAELKKRGDAIRSGKAESEKKKGQSDAELVTRLADFAKAKGIPAVKTVAELPAANVEEFNKSNEQFLKEKAEADGAIAGADGELADIDMLLKAYSAGQRGLYRRHCAHCHGTSGDGAGPTAAFLVPYPRDYRKGVFKWKSTIGDVRPSHADLQRIITEGINDTAMPSFSALLHPDEVDSLIEYVRYLSFRGEAESFLKGRLLEDRKAMKPSRSELVKVALQPVVEAWKLAESSASVVTPKEGYKPSEDRAAWLKAGADLFAGDKAKCFSCHGTTGLGDGRKKSEPLYDVWNKDKAKAYVDLKAAEEKGDADAIRRLTNVTESYALPVQQQSPRNLRVGKYRFGRRPLDLYRRIFSGINGTEMPGGGGKEGAKATLTETEIWQLVDYVMTLPYASDHQAPSSQTETHATPHAAVHNRVEDTPESE